ncbi:MAG: ATP-binding cassette domain-containing protein [Nitrospirae bacterium]|nr:ATP-binding cassette domain-containing protein [Nitrospirota bacterium]
MIEVEGLTKRYGEIAAVQNVSFKIEAGEIAGFLGPNGAGKTTTMRILSAYLMPNEGKASVGGIDVLAQPLEARKIIGYLPETPPLYEDMTVRAYLLFVAKIKRIARKDREERLQSVMYKVGIKEVEERVIGNLSKGYRQRVGLAQALIHNPKVLILDEPTIGLDPVQIREIRALIKSLAGDHTIILSTHILPEVAMTCQKVIIIDKGKIIVSDSLDGLQSKVRQSEAFVIQVDRPVDGLVDKIRKVASVDEVEKKDETTLLVKSGLNKDVRKDVSRLVFDAGWGILELRPVNITLEDVFVRLTTEEGQS